MIEINNCTTYRVPIALLKEVARWIEEKESKKDSDISVAFVHAKEAQELNTTYRKKTYVPNVLSFDYGEIVLCPEKISQDAEKYGITMREEFVRVFLHGVLHLFGYSHKAMNMKEKAYYNFFVEQYHL